MANTGKTVSPVQLQRYLKGADYPARKDELIERARDNGAPQEVVEELQRLPADRFDGPDDVMQSYGQTH